MFQVSGCVALFKVVSCFEHSFSRCLIPQNRVTMHLPANIGKFYKKGELHNNYVFIHPGRGTWG